MMPRRIVISSLAARYHKKDGWTLDVLNKYLVKGKFREMGFLNSADEDKYHILEPGSSIDVDRLLKDFPDVEVVASFEEDKGMAKKELLESRNW